MISRMIENRSLYEIALFKSMKKKLLNLKKIINAFQGIKHFYGFF